MINCETLGHERIKTVWAIRKKYGIIPSDHSQVTKKLIGEFGVTEVTAEKVVAAMKAADAYGRYFLGA